MANEFYNLRVIEKQHPIKGATTLTLKVPDHLYETFNYHPGQHLVLKFSIGGKEVRRSYSLNSSPFIDEPLQVTIKCVDGGLVSNYIHDHVKQGDVIETLAPQGRFYADVKKDDYKTYFLFAAGSGITPVLSILTSVLTQSADSYVHLFYGNSNQDTILFKEKLDELADAYSDRLNVIHTLSDPKVWTTWQQWKGRKGRIDAEQIAWFIQKYPPVAQQTEYFVCGPGAMNICVRNTLMELGVPADMIHVEHFGGALPSNNSTIKAYDGARLTAIVDNKTVETEIPAGMTILEALKKKKATPPYSCESGVCGTCTAKVTKGEVEMKSCMALDDDEIDKGLILTCQSIPKTEEVSITY